MGERDARFDVLAIGNAMVDVLAHADDSVVAAHGMVKGTMNLIDAERARELYAAMPPAIEMSGGSAANTAVGVAMLGGRAAYIGKVADDQLGGVFRHDISAAGVAYEHPPANDSSTGTCLILITPDAHRTMNTFLGAGADLGPDDIDEALVRDSLVVYLEGYLWDPPPAKEAFLKAMRIAREAGRRVALTLSDPFCVERHRDEVLELARDHVDVLFANEAELMSLYQLTEFEAAVERVRADCEMAAVTRSEKGSVVVAGAQTHAIAAEPVEQLVDTTGAGDLYAAGFLVGLTQGRPLDVCGRLGGVAAAEIISHVGPRPEQDLRALASSILG
jgi:sugar/nucleoside kinase (ribokinase family)